MRQMYEKIMCPAPASHYFLLAGGTFRGLARDEFLSVAHINLTGNGFFYANPLYIKQ